jgi:hypothetical protein
MTRSDPIVDELAHLWISAHRDTAEARLNGMIEEMRRSGDRAAADSYLLILAAVDKLRGRSEAR